MIMASCNLMTVVVPSDSVLIEIRRTLWPGLHNIPQKGGPVEKKKEGNPAGSFVEIEQQYIRKEM